MSKIIRKIITSSNAARPVAPYNHAVAVDRMLYLSGVIGLDKDTMKIVEGGIVEEARQALVNLGAVLNAGNSTYDQVVKCTILLSNFDDFGAFNEVYKEFFTHNYPARTAYQVGKLPLNCKVEIEAIAISGEVSTISVTDGK